MGEFGQRSPSLRLQSFLALQRSRVFRIIGDKNGNPNETGQLNGYHIPENFPGS